MNRRTVLAFFVCIIYNPNAQSYNSHKDLIEHVLNDYNADIIPLDDLTQTLNVSVRAALYSIQDVDVVKGRISVLITLSCHWLDSQITWTPSEYGNISTLSIPRKKVWTPSFVLGTAVDFTTIGESWMPVSFLHDGTTSMTLGDLVNSGCSFNMKFWPYDKQICDISFAVFGFSEKNIQLQTTPIKSLIVYLLNENVEWELTNAEFFVREDRMVRELVLRVEIERRSGIFIILIIFPLYGLASLNCMVFLLPSESGERIGFSATIMLALTVFLEVISDYIPNTSKPIPLLCIMVTMSISMSILCIVTVIVSLHFYHKDDEIPVNGCLQAMVKLFNRDFRQSKVNNDAKIEHDLIRQMNEEVKITNFEKSDELIEDNPIKGEDSRIKWTDVSYTIDRVCFIGGTVAHGLVMLGFTLYLTIGSE